MTEWIAVSRSRHADCYFKSRQGYDFAARQSVVPILLAEMDKLLPHYVLGFVQQESRYLPIALLGLQDLQNLYVHPDGRWLGSYVPAEFRGHPFRLMTADNKQALCLAQDYLSEDGSQGEPLFDDNAQLNPLVQQIFNFLQQCEKNRQVTQLATRLLDKSGVIEPWPLVLERGKEQEPLEVQGLYRVNERALNDLSVEAFASLRSHGALALAYAQLFSMGQLSQLVERAKFNEKHYAQQQADGVVGTGLESFFDDDDEELIFDFGD